MWKSLYKHTLYYMQTPHDCKFAMIWNALVLITLHKKPSWFYIVIYPYIYRYSFPYIVIRRIILIQYTYKPFKIVIVNYPRRQYYDQKKMIFFPLRCLDSLTIINVDVGTYSIICFHIVLSDLLLKHNNFFSKLFLFSFRRLQ